MKQQVFVVHGGDAFATYEEYIDFLKDFEIEYDPTKENKKGWKKNLAEDLGDEYEIIAPRMPNHFNAKYAEWKIWFEKYIPFIRDGIIFVGHSLGGIFLVKYLAEGNYPRSIKAAYIVAAPFDDECEGMSSEFNPPKSLDNITGQSKHVIFYHSENDSIVSFADFEKYKKTLPTATYVAYPDRDHFFDEHFPELVADIKKVAS